jgi:protein-S-isoprenylcysteine O-methyltransferase Ste14
MSDLPSLGPRGEGWVAIQFAALLAIAAAGPLSGSLSGGDVVAVALRLVGVGMLGAGLVLAARGTIDLRDALTPLPHPRDDAELVEDGVYARARHPIYGGLILAALGWGLLWTSPTALVLVGALAIFFRLKSAREEHWLMERFPGYAAYRRRTRRFLPLP